MSLELLDVSQGISSAPVLPSKHVLLHASVL